MVEPITIEGTWEEIVARADEFAGRRVRLTVIPGTPESLLGDTKGKSIEQILDEIAASIPEDELCKLPPDMTDQLDHYIYGTPKK